MYYVIHDISDAFPIVAPTSTYLIVWNIVVLIVVLLLFFTTILSFYYCQNEPERTR
jgi:Na+/alanine symporter